MNRLGMIVDVSHLSYSSIAEALEVSETPILNSHTGSSRSQLASTAASARRAHPRDGRPGWRARYPLHVADGQAGRREGTVRRSDEAVHLHRRARGAGAPCLRPGLSPSGRFSDLGAPTQPPVLVRRRRRRRRLHVQRHAWPGEARVLRRGDSRHPGRQPPAPVRGRRIPPGLSSLRPATTYPRSSERSPTARLRSDRDLRSRRSRRRGSDGLCFAGRRRPPRGIGGRPRRAR